MQIRPLTPADAGVARALRLRALREHPEAFATSYEEEGDRDPAETARRLEAGPRGAGGALLERMLEAARGWEVTDVLRLA